MKLKCPFCGKELKIVNCMDWDNLTNIFYPLCFNCKWTTHSCFDTEEDAIEWVKLFTDGLVE